MHIALTLVVLIAACTSLCGAASAVDEECLGCHSRPDLTSRSGESRFVDPARFAKSAHGRNNITCTSCHSAITQIFPNKRVPHAVKSEPKCAECHELVSQRYAKSLHAQVSKKICYSCHNPHYAVPIRQMTADDRKGMCLKCHDVSDTHRWLPQKQLHFRYLECASCHDQNAEIGVVISFVDMSKPSEKRVLQYDQLACLVDKEKPGLLETLDQDGNGRLSAEEIQAVAAKIRSCGFPDVSLEFRILVLRPAHNFTDRGKQTRDCSLCHSERAQFYSKIVMEVPEKDGEFRTIPVDRRILASPDYRLLKGDFYLLGESKLRRKDIDDLLEIVRQIGFKWIDLIGACIVVFWLFVVSVHGMAMFMTRKLRKERRTDEPEASPLAERIWHLIHGFFVIVLVLTGIQLRLPDLFPIFANFLNAVNLHNLSGVVVLVDYIFWIFYHFTRGELRSRFFISPAGFFKQCARVFHYYGYLVFIGERYPGASESKSDLLPLEKAVFAIVMWVLIPGQVFTGMLLYDVQKMLPIIQKLGGLRFTDAIHLVFAYSLVSFMIVHTYFHTLRKYQ